MRITKGQAIDHEEVMLFPCYCSGRQPVIVLDAQTYKEEGEETIKAFVVTLNDVEKDE